MIEIFKTDIQEEMQAVFVRETLQKSFPMAGICFDLDDQDRILRIEDETIDPSKVVSIVNSVGSSCRLIPDKICQSSSNSADDIQKFWEESFEKNHAMWGFEPSISAILVKDFFLEQNIGNILIPGIGYGRNATVFINSGISVTGIEISKTAIDIANANSTHPLKIFHGSVTDMPFDNHLYQGIFCYGLLYLLNETQRRKMVNDCYKQLMPGGWMVFTLISKSSPNYGKGKELAKDTFEIGNGGQLFFYDLSTVHEQFEQFGLAEVVEIEEPNSHAIDKPSFKFFLVKCKK